MLRIFAVYKEKRNDETKDLRCIYEYLCGDNFINLFIYPLL